jgi:hypothetical protein
MASSVQYSNRRKMGRKIAKQSRIVVMTVFVICGFWRWRWLLQ